MTTENITEVVKKSLKNDVEALGKDAQQALEAGNTEECQDYLGRQQVAISELINLIDVYHSSEGED